MGKIGKTHYSGKHLRTSHLHFWWASQFSTHWGPWLALFSMSHQGLGMFSPRCTKGRSPFILQFQLRALRILKLNKSKQLGCWGGERGLRMSPINSVWTEHVEAKLQYQEPYFVEAYSASILLLRSRSALLKELQQHQVGKLWEGTVL